MTLATEHKRLSSARLQSGASQARAMPEIPALTGIRLIAASWVVVFHYRTDLFRLLPRLRFLESPISLGYQAVPLFFVLSGFILSYTYFERYSLRRHAAFVWLRVSRLWPVHAVTLLMLVLFVEALNIRRGFAIDANGYLLSTIPTELTMMRGWYSDALVWNFPAWSIHSEWFAYLFLFPIAFVTIRRIRNSLALI